MMIFRSLAALMVAFALVISAAPAEARGGKGGGHHVSKGHHGHSGGRHRENYRGSRRHGRHYRRHGRRYYGGSYISFGLGYPYYWGPRYYRPAPVYGYPAYPAYPVNRTVPPHTHAPTQVVTPQASVPAPVYSPVPVYAPVPAVTSSTTQAGYVSVGSYDSYVGSTTVPTYSAQPAYAEPTINVVPANTYTRPVTSNYATYGTMPTYGTPETVYTSPIN